MPLTIEERERLAYITNSPVHPVFAALVDAEEGRHDELTHEIDGLNEEVKALKGEREELTGKLEDAKHGLEYAAGNLARELDNVRRLCSGDLL